jgi:flagellar hook-basal body complex protein FliE
MAPPGFGEFERHVHLLQRDQVNSAQNNAQELARAYEMGSPGASLHDVMIASSKANIAFQATVQVRNKLVSAYHDIMNMQL